MDMQHEFQYFVRNTEHGDSLVALTFITGLIQLWKVIPALWQFTTVEKHTP